MYIVTASGNFLRSHLKKDSVLWVLFAYCGMFFYLEEWFRISLLGTVWDIGQLYLLLFSMVAGCCCFGITLLFSPRRRWVVAVVLTGIVTLLFCAQFLYYHIFKTFFTIFSALHGLAAFQFLHTILNTLVKNFFSLLPLLLPLLLLLWKGRRSPCLLGGGRKATLFAAGGAAAVYCLALLCLPLTGKTMFSPYDLYYNTQSINASVNRLGLTTTMRLDAQRLAFGFHPRLTPPTVTQESESTPNALPNVLPLAFDELLATSEDELTTTLCNYFKNVTPTNQNEMTGIWKGCNLIELCGETFSGLIIHPDYTPTLYKMMTEGVQFSNFYIPLWGCSTLDGEYTTCQSLVPKAGVWSMYVSHRNDLPFTLGNQLRSIGYTTNAYHDHYFDYYLRNLSHPNMGYDYHAIGNGLKMQDGWPRSDAEMMDVTIPEYITKQPFHTYYMTISGHMPYRFSQNTMAAKNYEKVKELPYSEPAQAYFAGSIELDLAMRKLLDALEEAGIAENTVISLSPDHYPYALEPSALNELLGHEPEPEFELYKSCWILYKKGMTPQVVDKPCSSLDILPTLSNLMGLPYDSRLLMGRDVFSDASGLVLFENRNWITDKARYIAATGKVIPTTEEPVTPAYVEQINQLVNAKFVYSAKLLEANFYAKIVPGAEARAAANAGDIARNNIEGAGRGPFGTVTANDLDNGAVTNEQQGEKSAATGGSLLT